VPLTEPTPDPGPGPIAGLALVAVPAVVWWVGLAVCLQAGPWLAVAWVVGPGVVAMVAVGALQLAVLRVIGRSHGAVSFRP